MDEASASVAHRFHEVNHKCTKYNADDIPALEGVNSEACEHLFVWLSHFKYIAPTMNDVRFFFLLWNVCEAHNRYLGAGGDPAGILKPSAPTMAREEQLEDPLTWIILIVEPTVAVSLSNFLLRQSAALHRAMTYASPSPNTLPANNPVVHLARPVTSTASGSSGYVAMGSVSRRIGSKRAQPPSPASATSSPALKRVALDQPDVGDIAKQLFATDLKGKDDPLSPSSAESTSSCGAPVGAAGVWR